MANNKQKLELTWIGKGEMPKLEPRILIEDPSKSYCPSNAELGMLNSELGGKNSEFRIQNSELKQEDAELKDNSEFRIQNSELKQSLQNSLFE
jgi:hypothetical protein